MLSADAERETSGCSERGGERDAPTTRARPDKRDAGTEHPNRPPSPAAPRSAGMAPGERHADRAEIDRMQVATAGNITRPIMHGTVHGCRVRVDRDRTSVRWEDGDVRGPRPAGCGRAADRPKSG